MSDRRTHRIVSGLKSAVPIDRPKCIPRSRPRGVRSLGLRFERQLAAALPEANHGQWFEYEDDNGKGYCQTDLIISFEDHLAVLECKLSNVESAYRQLNELYLPVVRRAYGRRVAGIVVTRHVTQVKRKNDICESLKLALRFSRTSIPVFHYIGGPIRL